MTEAEEFDRSLGSVFLDEAVAKVRPSAEFSELLEGFYSPTARQALGGKALELVNPNKLGVFNRPDGEFYIRRSNISISELTAINRTLIERMRSVPVLPDAKIMAPERHPGKRPDLDLRFSLAIDELTRRALGDTVLIENDGSFQVSFRVRGVDLAGGTELLAARDNLVQVLRQTPPQKVEFGHIHTDNLV